MAVEPPSCKGWQLGSVFSLTAVRPVSVYWCLRKSYRLLYRFHQHYQVAKVVLSRRWACKRSELAWRRSWNSSVRKPFHRQRSPRCAKGSVEQSRVISTQSEAGRHSEFQCREIGIAMLYSPGIMPGYYCPSRQWNGEIVSTQKGKLREESG